MPIQIKIKKSDIMLGWKQEIGIKKEIKEYLNSIKVEGGKDFL